MTVDEKVVRVALLAAVQRDAEAQQAFVDILLQAPSHLGALIAFGSFLTAKGHISAACRVYAEAVAHHPQEPIGHVNLANLLLRGRDPARAREHYEAALRLDPAHPEAHQGLGAVLPECGDDRGVRRHFRQGFKGHAVSTRPFRGSRPPLPLLLLVSSGGGNIPTDSFLDDRTFMTSVVVTEFLKPSTPLPLHGVVFNAIANAKRLRAIPDVTAPRTVSMVRAVLVGADAAAVLARQGFSFPLLLRAPGFYTGRNFVKVDSADDLPSALALLPGDALLVIEYLDARGADGNARKYRVMLIDGRIYPLHLAISRQWKVHYFTSYMQGRPDHRREEADFLADMPRVLGPRAMAALERIGRTFGLDYGGVDFGIGPDGDVLLFEANATMVIVRPDADPRWSYRHAAV